MLTADCTDSLQLEPSDPASLLQLCGPCDTHLQQIARRFSVRISHHSGFVTFAGDAAGVKSARAVLEEMMQDLQAGHIADAERIDLLMAGQQAYNDAEAGTAGNASRAIVTPRLHVKPRPGAQQRYCQAILAHDVNFGIGPAGTGKTYLAVACAVEALLQERVRRILLVRPAVEAGEKLGFLPGDLAQKVDPYLRPLYDALYDMLGTEPVARMLEKNQIEVAPLAFMRGRTLNHAFIILDESQNTSAAQMKMFLTRLGFGSTAVVTGDLTQVDLPAHTPCGLAHALSILEQVEGVSITRFSSRDVVRHPLVQRIVDAYESEDQQRP